MHTRRNVPMLAVVIPFHNEARHLPRLMDALRTQSVQNVPVVFIDNASTDGSGALVQRSAEVKTGKWTYLTEPHIGKFFAMQTATTWCVEQLGARHIGFLDADSYPGGSAWIHNSLESVDRAQERFGYTYSPITYVGFEQLPIFTRAYQAYEMVLRFLVEHMGWLANGQGFVCPTDILTRYFQTAHITTEIDLRCALLALTDGRQAYYNPTLLISSGRRIVVNAANFTAWCFYERDFYAKKDINASAKLNLDAPTPVEDLPPDMVGQFFTRRAIKITCRHLILRALFDRHPTFLETFKSVLGVNVSEQLKGLIERFQGHEEFLLTQRFETMIRAIENNPACAAVAHRIAHLMHERYVASSLVMSSG